MKAQSILLAIFVLTTPFMAFTQEKQRELMPEQQIDLRRGTLENFDNYLLRLEAAFQENELQSMEDIRTELVKIMAGEIKSTQKTFHENPLNQQASGLFKSQSQRLNDFTAQQFYTLKDQPENQKTAPFFTTLNHFRQGITEAIQAMETAR